MIPRSLLAATLAIAFPALAAAQPVDGLYIGGGAGIDLKQDESYTPDPILGGSKRAWSFDTGLAGAAAVGYGLGDGFRVEFEGDYSNNHVHAVSHAQRAGGYEQLYGGMANALYDFDFALPVFPYVGIGVGGQIVSQTNFNYSSYGFVFPRRSHPPEDVSAFAYQAIAGFAYPLPYVPGLAITLDYRFLGLLDPLPSVGRAVYTSAGTERGKAKFGNDLNHEILLGLRYAFNQPEPPPSAPTPQPVAAPARSYLVFFDWDKATLTERARQIIHEAADNSTKVQYTRIEVNGYTDTSGTPRYNQGLSVRRAQAVAAELVRDGVPRQSITIQGFGETHLLVPTGPGVREPQNRRVEIVIR